MSDADRRPFREDEITFAIPRGARPHLASLQVGDGELGRGLPTPRWTCGAAAPDADPWSDAVIAPASAQPRDEPRMLLDDELDDELDESDG